MVDLTKLFAKHICSLKILFVPSSRLRYLILYVILRSHFSEKKSKGIHIKPKTLAKLVSLSMIATALLMSTMA